MTTPQELGWQLQDVVKILRRAAGEERQRLEFERDQLITALRLAGWRVILGPLGARVRIYRPEEPPADTRAWREPAQAWGCAPGGRPRLGPDWERMVGPSSGGGRSHWAAPKMVPRYVRRPPRSGG